MLTRAALEARLIELQGGLAQLRDNYNATRGAIEDCEFWLARLAEQEAVLPPAPNSTEETHGT